MRNISDQIVLSATDLSNFLNCQHRTALELGEAYGKRPRPYFHDPILEALFARGLEHEHQYIEALEKPVGASSISQRSGTEPRLSRAR